MDGAWITTFLKIYIIFHFTKNFKKSYDSRWIRDTIQFNPLNDLQYDFDFQNNGNEFH